MGIMIIYRGYDNPTYSVHKMWVHIIHSKIRGIKEVSDHGDTAQ